MAGLDSNTKLSLSFDEATMGASTVNGALEVLDYGNIGHIVTQVGTATLSTAQSRFGSSSLLLAGNSGYVSIPDNAEFQFSGGEFALECSIYMPTLPGNGIYYNLLSQWGASGNRAFLLTLLNSGGTYYLVFYISTTGANGISSSAIVTLNTNTWYDIAVTRDNTDTDTLRYFLNGAVVGTSTSYNGLSIYNASQVVCVGANVGSNYYAGYIDEVRMSNVVRYTEAYTPAIDPFESDANTVLLLHMDTQDQSGDGGSGVYNIVEFIGTGQLDTAVKLSAGGYSSNTSSFITDGDSDGASVPDANDVGDITTNWGADIWAKHDDHVGTETYMAQYVDSTHYWVLEHIHGTGIHFQVDGGNADVNISGGEIEDTDWTWIAIRKVGSAVGIYKGKTGNATQVAYVSADCTTTFSAIVTMAFKNNSNYFDGHLGEWRISASNIDSASPNVGLTDTITVPTAPYTVDAPSTGTVPLRCLMGVGI